MMVEFGKHIEPGRESGPSWTHGSQLWPTGTAGWTSTKIRGLPTLASTQKVLLFSSLLHRDVHSRKGKTMLSASTSLIWRYRVVVARHHCPMALHIHTMLRRVEQTTCSVMRGSVHHSVSEENLDLETRASRTFLLADHRGGVIAQLGTLRLFPVS